MSQYYIVKSMERGVKIRIPFTAYYLYRCPDTKLWFIVEKELDNVEFCYRYRFL